MLLIVHGGQMKTTYLIAVGVIFIAGLIFGQEKSYWKNAPVEGTKIYSIVFVDENNGFAISGKKDFFITSDKGKNWEIQNEKTIQHEVETVTDPYWSADIYCSVLHTFDGGNTWVAYSNEQQEHFCSVYLKDKNTGYNIGYEFLTKVTKKIRDQIIIDQIISLMNHPQQCTEYYSDEKSGWALGWCLKNFVLRNN